MIQRLKGFRDFLPEESIKRQRLINKLKEIFERFGFDPLETPALELAETLLGKYGQEADKLIYLFKDRGGRKIGLKYDQTIPLARVIGQHFNQLVFPFKRYQIQPVWRAENPQKGRYREFVQADVDIVGTSSLLADFEIINLSLTIFRSLSLDKVKIAINDRRNFSGIDNRLITSIDKLKKIGEEMVIDELVDKGLSPDQAQQLMKKIKNQPPSERLRELFQLLEDKGYQKEKDFFYDPTLARGLDYYTGIIYEAVEESLPISLGGGGRYDQLLGLLTQKPLPAVGFSFGIDRLIEATDLTSKKTSPKTNTQLLVTIFSSRLLSYSLQLVDFFRKKRINTELYLETDTSFEKQLKYADRKGIIFVIIVGPEEIQRELVRLKIMTTGEQKLVSLNQVVEIINLSLTNGNQRK
ncbi:MAG: histidine--tRNA ligase [Patescibacteria group bacterium]|nr:histidine--tRNA ligase [Patescibacteria group bacterium]